MKKPFLILSSILLATSLVACGASANNNNNGGNYQTTTKTSTKSQVVNYMKSNGAVSNGTYLIGAKRTYSNNGYNFTEYVTFLYSSSGDYFGLMGETTGIKEGASSGVTYTMANKFDWGSYKSGLFLGSMEAGSYTTSYSLSGLSFDSKGNVTNASYTVTANPLKLEDSTIKSYVELGIDEFNDAVGYTLGEIGSFASLV